MNPLKHRIFIRAFTRRIEKDTQLLYYYLSNFQILNRDFEGIKFGFIKTFPLCLLLFVFPGLAFLCVWDFP